MAPRAWRSAGFSPPSPSVALFLYFFQEKRSRRFLPSLMFPLFPGRSFFLRLSLERITSFPTQFLKEIASVDSSGMVAARTPVEFDSSFLARRFLAIDNFPGGKSLFFRNERAPPE